MTDNCSNNEKKCYCNIQTYIDILVILDFIVSTIGGILKSSNEQAANYCFMIGGGLLFFAVVLIIYRIVTKK